MCVLSQQDTFLILYVFVPTTGKRKLVERSTLTLLGQLTDWLGFQWPWRGPNVTGPELFTIYLGASLTP